MDNKLKMFHPAFAQNDRMKELLHDDMQQPVPQNDVIIKDLKQLLLLGKIEDYIDINGFKFKVKTLTSIEQDEVWMSLSFLDGQNKLLLIKKPILARAIVSVNDTRLDSLYDGNDYNDISEYTRSLRVLNQWQDSLIDKLFDFYSNLRTRSADVFKTGDDLIKK